MGKICFQISVIDVIKGEKKYYHLVLVSLELSSKPDKVSFFLPSSRNKEAEVSIMFQSFCVVLDAVKIKCTL